MKRNKVLFTGFKKAHLRDSNSTIQLLGELKEKETFLFTNDYCTIEKEIDEILKSEWDEIVMFGQKPVTKKLYVELSASRDGEKLSTNWNLKVLEPMLNAHNVDFKYSDNAGNHYCNYAYFQMLKRVRDRNLETKVIFIHVPYNDRFRQFDEVVKILNEYC